VAKETQQAARLRLESDMPPRGFGGLLWLNQRKRSQKGNDERNPNSPHLSHLFSICISLSLRQNPARNFNPAVSVFKTAHATGLSQWLMTNF
jgi:hypothetical protein